MKLFILFLFATLVATEKKGESSMHSAEPSGDPSKPAGSVLTNHSETNSSHTDTSSDKKGESSKHSADNSDNPSKTAGSSSPNHSETNSSHTDTNSANSRLICECNTGENLCSKEKNCIIEKGDCIAIAYTLDEKETSHLYLGCQPKSASFDQCREENIFISAGKDFYLNSQAKCCNNKNNCITHLELKKESNKTSNMACPSCFAMSPESCNPTKTNCFKSQDRCVNITGKMMNENGIRAFILKGCTTAFTVSVLQEPGAMLDFGNVTYSIDTIQVGNGKLSGIQAPQGIVFAVLLPSLLGLLLDKLLY